MAKSVFPQLPFLLSYRLLGFRHVKDGVYRHVLMYCTPIFISCTIWSLWTNKQANVIFILPPVATLASSKHLHYKRPPYAGGDPLPPHHGSLVKNSTPCGCQLHNLQEPPTFPIGLQATRAHLPQKAKHKTHRKSK